MIIGFTKIYVNNDGLPTPFETKWIADAFVLFGFVIYIGKIRSEADFEK